MPLSDDQQICILGLSVRDIQTLVGYASLYEFEDVIQSISTTNLLKLKSKDYRALETSRKVYKTVKKAFNLLKLNLKNHTPLETSKKAYRTAKKISKSRQIGDLLARPFNSDSRVYLQEDYTLFLPTFNNLFELYALKSVEGWRDRSRYAACYINEVWEEWLTGKDCDYLIDLLRDFDHIFVGLYHCAETLSNLTGKPCTYLPIGVDALQFCPHPKQKTIRSIDVCNIGRRSDITHLALLQMARQNDLFYFYDTILATSGVVDAAKQLTFNVKNPQEHRFLLSNLLKRSRYFMANRAFVNDPKRAAGNGEIPGRFFEGAAAGTVMLGDAPDTDVFKAYFDWDDAVIQVPFDAPHIAEIIAQLDAQPERIETIRRNNMINALLKHDWLHRLQVIYTTFDLPPSLGMVQRSAQISALVDQIHQLAPSQTVYW